MFLEEIVEDDAEAELLEFGEIDGNGLGTLCAVSASDIGRNGLPVGDDPIDHSRTYVLLDGAEMVRECVAGSFAGLGHEIGNVHARSFGFGDGVGDFRDQ